MQERTPVYHNGLARQFKEEGRNELLKEQQMSKQAQAAAVGMAHNAYGQGRMDGSGEGLRQGLEQGRAEGANAVAEQVMAGLRQSAPQPEQQDGQNFGDEEAQALQAQAEQVAGGILEGQVDPAQLQGIIQQAQEATNLPPEEQAQLQQQAQIAGMALQMAEQEAQRQQMQGIPQAGLQSA